jgi:phage shock protein C
MRRHYRQRHTGGIQRGGNGRYVGGLYRSRQGVILGVFKGLADYFGFSVAWLRALGVIIFILSGFWPIVVLYLLAALIMKQAPIIPLTSIDDQEFYDSYTHSRSGSVHRLKRRFDSLNRRIQRMEDVVTDNAFDWERRLDA